MDRDYIIQPIFPKSIYFTNINRPLTLDEVDVVRECEKDTLVNYGNLQSANTDVLNHSSMQDIKHFIEFNLNRYIQETVAPADGNSFYITQSWLNFGEPGSHHHIHNHPNSFVSGVFYFSAVPEHDLITFETSEYDRLMLSHKEDNWYNSKSWSVKLATGDLVMFPSELQHKVPKTESKYTRVSLAFNTWLTGELGNRDSLTHLSL